MKIKVSFTISQVHFNIPFQVFLVPNFLTIFFIWSIHLARDYFLFLP